jgi:hypothetical protein
MFEKDVTGDYTAWHTYAVEWRATYVKMWIDGKVYLDTTTSSSPVVIPKRPLHLYLQLEAGPIDDITAANSGTPASVVMHVDWTKLSK